MRVYAATAAISLLAFCLLLAFGSTVQKLTSPDTESPILPRQDGMVASTVPNPIVQETSKATSKGFGQTPQIAIKPVEKLRATRLVPTPRDAEAVALADLLTMHEFDRINMRYVWIEDGEEQEDAQLVAFVINSDSRSNVIVKPVVVRDGQCSLVRIDLRHYAPRIKDRREYQKVWEEFQFDPKFATIIEGETLINLVKEGWETTCLTVMKQSVQVEPYIHTDGKTYEWKWQQSCSHQKVTFADLNNVTLIKFPGINLDITVHEKLCLMTHSQAPVVSDGYFSFRATATIKDKLVFETVYGGLYYDLSGRPKPKQGETDEDALLSRFGLKNAKDLFDDLRPEQRIAKFRSGVTGMPRAVLLFRGAQGRVDQATGLISFSLDIKNQDIGVKSHPIRNLLNLKVAAKEVIFETLNGMHGYDLFDGNGKRQVEVPPDVARDHEIPRPHTAKLQGSVGCIRCHEAEGSDGWIVLANDAKKLVEERAKRPRLDIFRDLSQHDQDDAITRLVGLYGGDPERALRKGRDDYSAAVLLATGPWKNSKTGQTDVVRLAGNQLADRVSRYWYKTVDNRAALRSFGVDASDKKEADRILNILLPTDTRAIRFTSEGQVYYAEDEILGALKDGLEVNRADFDLSYSFGAERVQIELAKRKGVIP